MSIQTCLFVFARKSLKRWSPDTVWFSVMSMVKCPHWEKALVHDKQTHPRPPEVSSVEHKHSKLHGEQGGRTFQGAACGDWHPLSTLTLICCILASNFASLCLNLPICIIKIKILTSSVAVFSDVQMYPICIGRFTLSLYPTCWY